MNIYSVAPRYLSLALASRRVIDNLLEARRGHFEPPRLRDALASVVESVEKTGQEEKFFTSPSGSIFEHFEQRTILREVLRDSNPTDIQRSLVRLLGDPVSTETFEDDLQRMVDFFFAIETRALSRYEQRMSAEE
jgi:hypothetical protein